MQPNTATAFSPLCLFKNLFSCKTFRAGDMIEDAPELDVIQENASVYAAAGRNCDWPGKSKTE